MSAFNDKYQALLGRPPSPKEVENLNRIARVLNIHENDALWAVLLALEDYDRRYRQAPARIEKALQGALEGIRGAAEQETQTAAANAIKAMAKEAGRIGQEIATKTAGRDQARWMAIMAAICTIALLGVGTVGFYTGHKTGAAATTDAAAWALSNEGQQARALAKTGSLPILAQCLGAGWQIEKVSERRVCRTAGQGSGWYIP